MRNIALPKTETGISTIRNHFFKINKDRLQITRDLLTNQQADFLELLPLLFHYNHPQFPGYVSKSTPAGISQYTPIQPTLQAAKRYFKSFQHNRRARHKMDIHSLFLMGSSGSIAFTQKSDFDVWLIHADDLTSEQIDELNEKAKLIEQWAARFNLEVHFFIFDTNSFRSGQTQSLSSESSGSSQHSLLLDEFYRSSLLLAGRYPLWWLVPPEEETHYDEYVDTLLKKRFVDGNEIVDFGSALPVPANEFFGAAVWQLYKGISSPYKSVLKLLLMEVYASEHPHIELLSTQFKKYMYGEETDLACLDPYIIMYNKVENYLMTRQEKDRLNTFRECFYFKINEKLSRPIKEKNQSWRRRAIENMMLDWGWDNAEFSLLDTQEDWRIDNVVKQRTKITKTLTESYHFLSEFARRYAEVYRISQTELNVLGRKLYAAFERKTGKIDIINKGIAPNLYENELTFVQIKNKNAQGIWLLYRGRISYRDINNHQPLKRTQNIVEMLSWCHLNQVVNIHTAISLKSYDENIKTKDLKDILSALNEVFPSAELHEPDFNDLNQPAYIAKACLFVNIAAQPVISRAGNQHLTTDRVDALSYSGLRKNLAQKFDLILMTSWEEVLVYHYDGIEGLMQCLCDYLSWSPQSSHIPAAKLSVNSFSSGYNHAISLRIENLFKDLINTLYIRNKNTDARYVLESEDTYHILERTNGKLLHKDSLSYANLTRYLCNPIEKFSPVLFDQTTKWDSVLPSIYQLNQENVIQVFFNIKDEQVETYILDERGSLFTQTMVFYNAHSFMDHLNQFFISVLNRKNFITGEIIDINSVEIYFYEIHTSKNRSHSITKVEVKPNPYKRSFFNLKVIGSMDENDHTTLTIYCDDLEFSSLEHGNDLFKEVARHVLNMRQSGQSYPIYITDIDFSRGILNVIEPKQIQTIHFLSYKKRIEDKLAAALNQININDPN